MNIFNTLIWHTSCVYYAVTKGGAADKINLSHFIHLFLPNELIYQVLSDGFNKAC
ncbi:MAG: hypothetical protein H6Q70_4515 [Firmicutes bacterium]|nr:hypothetical protein [Bacillota bacterium]